ncbi:MAG: SpoIIE family protein phosphatase [Nitrospiraceae bacterium]|nr:SpoIIE family protein phosphatase [Nitrospiraceae bacterium]
MRMDIAAQTDIGKRKKNNEDYYGVFREGTPGLQLFSEGALLCVADGLGGHVGGQIASKLAVSVLKDATKDAAPDTEEPDEYDKEMLELLKGWLVKANNSVHKTNRDLVKKGRPMGTTLLAVLVTPKKAYIANVGDSRCYHIRDGAILERTEDHSWVDEQVKLGLMSKAEAESDSRKNIVTRCIGTHPEVTVDTYMWHIVQGDRLLLCTDGLVNMVKDTEIRDEFRRRATSAEVAHRLVELANDHGGRDNITVIAAHVSPGPIHFVTLHTAAFFRKHGKKVLWTLVTLLFGAGCFAAGYYLRGVLG